MLSVNQDCNLNGGLKTSLHSLTLPNGYSHTLSISGSVGVQTGYFNFQAGNLTIGSAAILTIGAAGTGQSNTWTGGNFSGVGQIAIPAGSELDISGNPGTLSDTLNIAGTVVFKTTMSSNVALSGASNKINIQKGGILNLDSQVAAGSADAKGGITGSANNPIIILSGGTLERGSGQTGDNPFGQVLISVPVDNQGGTFKIPQSNTGTNPAVAVHLSGKDASNFSYNDTGSTGNAILSLGQATQLLADNGVNNSANATDGVYLHVGAGTTSTVTLTGNVTITTGILEIVDDSLDQNLQPLPGVATINGNVTFGTSTVAKMNWNGGITQGNFTDQLLVNGNLNLSTVTLDMEGEDKPPANQAMPVFGMQNPQNNHTLNGGIGTLEWNDSDFGNNNWTQSTQKFGTTTWEQITLLK